MNAPAHSSSSPFDWSSFAPERIAFFSDLHVEFAPFSLPDGFRADMAILAGDIHTKARAASWAKLLGIPCVLVLGNHDHYGTSLVRAGARCKADAEGSWVKVLDDEELMLANLRILGSTLWTDYKLGGTDRAANMRAAEGNLRDPYASGMADHRQIRTKTFSRARASDFANLHAASVRFLTEALARPCPVPTLVATHHAPSSLCLLSEHDPSDLSHSCYASDLDHLMAHGVQAWVHGHVHRARQQIIGGALVAANPRGYPGEPTGFNPHAALLTSELAARMARSAAPASPLR